MARFAREFKLSGANGGKKGKFKNCPRMIIRD
jgi:hypothetical protein